MNIDRQRRADPARRHALARVAFPASTGGAQQPWESNGLARASHPRSCVSLTQSLARASSGLAKPLFGL